MVVVKLIFEMRYNLFTCFLEPVQQISTFNEGQKEKGKGKRRRFWGYFYYLFGLVAEVDDITELSIMVKSS